MYNQRDLSSSEPADQPRDVGASRQTREIPVGATKTQSGEPTCSKSPKRKSQHKAVHLNVQEVAAWHGVSVATIWRWQKNDPDFPCGHKLSPGLTRLSRVAYFRVMHEQAGLKKVPALCGCSFQPAMMRWPLGRQEPVGRCFRKKPGKGIPESQRFRTGAGLPPGRYSPRPGSGNWVQAA